MNRSRIVRLTALAGAAVLALSACADRGGGEPTSPGGEGNESWVEPGYFPQDDGGDPQPGGTLTFADYSETRSFDPSMVIPTAASGGNSLIAVYDLLVAYNVETEQYEPKMAEAVESNDDFTEWTITLRPDVTFSDGTPVDADAVVGSMEWFMSSHGFDVSIVGPLWGGVEKVDDLTVKITLTDAWANFDSMLSRSLGMVVSPATLSSGDFANPIGAGAWTVKDLAPGEHLTFAPNPNYWDGEPYLDELRFVWLGDGRTALESFDAGSINGGYITDVLVATDLADRDIPRSSYLSNFGHIVQISQKEGEPGENPKVRKALYLATDVESLSQRVYDGKSLWGKRMFGPSSRWNDGSMDQNLVDTEEAASLVEEAKAEGFDGTIELIGANSATNRETMLTLKGQWEAAGFTVEVENVRNIADFITKVYVEHDFSVTSGGLNTLDEDPYPNLYSSFASDAATNIMSSQDPEFDALLAELRATPLEDAQDVINRMEERFEDQNPAIPTAQYTPTTFWTEETYDIRVVQEGLVDFSKAWIAN